MTRTGLGYDIHLLKKGEKLTLGGVEISSPLGTVGHSDADALLHAIIDALLGAAGLGDIGEHFPPSDETYRGISSRVLLKKSLSLVKDRGFSIANIDAVVILEKPSLSSYKQLIRETVAADLNIQVEAVNIKAKAKEGVDAAGEQLAVETYAVVLLENPER